MQAPSAAAQRPLPTPHDPEMVAFFEKFTGCHEGFSDTAYLDSEGFATIGYGALLSDKKMNQATFERSEFKGKKITETEARAIALKHFAKSYEIAQKSCKCQVKEVLLIVADMEYQMGQQSFCKTTFPKFFQALEKQDFAEACYEMVNSANATQTPNRVFARVKMLAQHAKFTHTSLKRLGDEHTTRIKASKMSSSEKTKSLADLARFESEMLAKMEREPAPPLPPPPPSAVPPPAPSTTPIPDLSGMSFDAAFVKARQTKVDYFKHEGKLFARNFKQYPGTIHVEAADFASAHYQAFVEVGEGGHFTFSNAERGTDGKSMPYEVKFKDPLLDILKDGASHHVHAGGVAATVGITNWMVDYWKGERRSFKQLLRASVIPFVKSATLSVGSASTALKSSERKVPILALVATTLSIINAVDKGLNGEFSVGQVAASLWADVLTLTTMTPFFKNAVKQTGQKLATACGIELAASGGSSAFAGVAFGGAAAGAFIEMGLVAFYANQGYEDRFGDKYGGRHVVTAGAKGAVAGAVTSVGVGALTPWFAGCVTSMGVGAGTFASFLVTGGATLAVVAAMGLVSWCFAGYFEAWETQRHYGYHWTSAAQSKSRVLRIFYDGTFDAHSPDRVGKIMYNFERYVKYHEWSKTWYDTLQNDYLAMNLLRKLNMTYEAFHDETLARREFRKLCLKYHPDKIASSQKTPEHDTLLKETTIRFATMANTFAEFISLRGWNSQAFLDQEVLLAITALLDGTPDEAA